MDLLLYNGRIINEGKIFTGSILIKNGIIAEIFPDNTGIPLKVDRLDVSGKFILPGSIDTHVHFRDPGLTHKADIFTESRAALVGGVTSFLDMPNTIPPTVNADGLHEKLQIAARSSVANYGFYLAATKDNLQEIQAIPREIYPGIKIFYAPSTGNLICNDQQRLYDFFTSVDKPFAVHSEDYNELKAAVARCKDIKPLPEDIHLRCRPHEACIKATRELIALAEDSGARMHFLHISTAAEADLLRQRKPERITVEACPHYLWFDSRDYPRMGNLIKVNPSVKTPEDRQELIRGLADGVFDTIGTDHAPHLPEEKRRDYWQAPSGAPSIQHYYPVVFTVFENNGIDFSRIPWLTAHNPARIFNIDRRGFIRKGYWADIAVIEKKQPQQKIHHKCGWSVFQNEKLDYSVFATIVNGELSYLNGKFLSFSAQQLIFK